ncbi:MAG TPA: hypothetical protein VLI44_04610 [Sporolactobacillaceae bacterium]|nr:hypothetical protein [Sporolactobacillaceae bacterium]
MYRFAATIFFGSVVFGIAGCTTLHRELATQSVPPAAAVGTDKLPLAIAVLADPSMKFDYPHYWKAFVEDLNPGLANTLQSAFRGNFQNVSVVEAEKSASGADLVASPTLRMSDPMKLTVTFVEPRSRRIVAEVSSERSCDGNAPGVYDHIVTDLFLFTAVVIFPPSDSIITRQIQKHDADRFNAGFAPAVARMASDIAYKASKDPNLQNFATPPAQAALNSL